MFFLQLLYDRKQIYVPLALVERRKPAKKEREHSPEAGSKLKVCTPDNLLKTYRVAQIVNKGRQMP